MQSKRTPLGWRLVAACAGAIACLLALWLRQGAGALAWTVLCGALLGFIAPRGAWLWTFFLEVWIVVAVPSHRIAEQPVCWGFAGPPNFQTGWPLLIVPPFAVFSGVFADWIIIKGLRQLAFLHWRWLDFARPALRIGAVALAALIVLACGLELAQPLQPYGVGETYCWDEFCFVVTSVHRVKTIGADANQAVAHGTFYVVDTDLESPWWGRFLWNNDAVYVTDYSGTDYQYSLAGQHAQDRLSKSSRSQCHLIRGAREYETIVFDLPDDVVQPRLLRDTLGFEGFLGGIRGGPWYIKPAFNLRYD